MSFNDRMVKRTVLPAIYLWLLSCGAVVGMGIWKPDVVLMNLDGFIALIAIIGGTAAPALQTVLRMWESEQNQEVDNIPTEQKHQRELEQQHQTHTMKLESLAQEHEHKIHTLQQSHEHEMCKGDTKKTK
jgi:C4-dicarboxylate-specific signal transduction histidine kinase